MKMIIFALITGLIGLYFVNIALLKSPILNLEWSIHAGTRFLVGFFVFGITYFFANALPFKKALFLAFVILAVDYLYEFYIEAYRMNFEIILHGFFMIFWGAIMGYLTALQTTKEHKLPD
jgi:hypothetical protein